MNENYPGKMLVWTKLVFTLIIYKRIGYCLILFHLFADFQQTRIPKEEYSASMASDKEIFSLSGAAHLTAIDW